MSLQDEQAIVSYVQLSIFQRGEVKEIVEKYDSSEGNFPLPDTTRGEYTQMLGVMAQQHTTRWVRSSRPPYAVQRAGT